MIKHEILPSKIFYTKRIEVFSNATSKMKIN